MSQITYAIVLIRGIAVYNIGGKLSNTFIVTAQEVLRKIEEMAPHLAKFSSQCVGDISVVAAQLNLAFHQV